MRRKMYNKKIWIIIIMRNPPGWERNRVFFSLSNVFVSWFIVRTSRNHLHWSFVPYNVLLVWLPLVDNLDYIYSVQIMYNGSFCPYSHIVDWVNNEHENCFLMWQMFGVLSGWVTMATNEKQLLLLIILLWLCLLKRWLMFCQSVLHQKILK